MNIEDAIEIVMDLARSHIIDEKDDDLARERQIQLDACEMVENYIRALQSEISE